MMGPFNHPDKQSNVCQRKCGKDMSPRLLVYFPYVPFRRTANIGELEKELNTRNATFKPTLKVTKKCDLLKKKEVQRFKEQIDAGLTLPGYVFIGLKLAAKLQLLRQDLTEKEESTNGEYDIDITNYFKLLLPDVHETIFKEQE
jgi:50S ribosomal subunit-associated GTPase HflX